MQFSDEILSGAEEAILESTVDVVVTTRVPENVLSSPLFDVTFVAVARKDHPLFRLEHALRAEDLTSHTQVVVRGSGAKHLHMTADEAEQEYITGNEDQGVV